VTRQAYSSAWWILLVASASVAFGCAGVKQSSSPGAAGSSGAAGSGGGLVTGSGGTGVMPASCNGLCTDFPASPMMGVNVPSNAPGLFGTPSGAGPCVTEPEDGTLFPNNWLQPRVRVPGNTGILKITFHADLEANDLVVYASPGETWTMPKDIWVGLASHVVEQPVSVTVQTPSGGATTVKFQVAPVGAGGSMVFWAANPTAANKDPSQALPTDSDLQGFAVGDDKTQEALNTANLQQQVFLQDGQNTRTPVCIGCHSGTPDGSYVAFVDAWPWAAAFAAVRPDISGQALPGYLGYDCTTPGTSSTCSGPKTFVQYPWGGPLAFSPAHWTTGGDRIAIMASQLAKTDLATPWNTDDKLPGNLVWLDTENTQTQVSASNSQVTPVTGSSYGYLAHTGDLGGAAFPVWSANGETIVYASTAGSTGDQDGRLNQGQTDLYSIPYANRTGGPATPVPGASSAALEEYYPALSPDDRLLAFTAVPAGQVMYANPSAELYVVPFGSGVAAGAQPTKLAANTPPSCTKMLSPGVNNHWPKWSPDAKMVGGKTYYWIIFSSNRYGLPSQKDAMGNPVQVSQLYVTAVVVDEVGLPATYPAIYLWNQSQATLNTTPAWQDFNIPIVID
jgi:hypothetical protein